jgi:mitotic checkpoint serine/threonine-protein kinase BUB1 beta
MKENAAPLQRGRSIATLDRVAARGTSSSSLFQPREDDSEARIAEFEGLVRPSEAPHITHTEEDPLVHWMNYIKFYQDNFPTDSHQQFLLMERCTRALVKMPQYANDDRFISVCAKYADKTKEPGQVFKYLHQQKVGAKTALFWVAWAYVAEKDNDFPFAEQIYKKGISKDAQPINVLKIRHKQFQRRMSRHWLSASQQNDELDEYDEEQSSTRSALGGLSHERSQRNDRARTGHQLMHRNRLASIRPIASRGARSNGNAANNGSFAIFVENEGENAPQNFLDQPVVENKRVIEREADRRKENIADAERWNERGGLPTSSSNSAGGGHLSRPVTTRGAPPPFAVFVDEECEVQHAREEAEKISQAERHRAARDDRTFRERTDEGVVSNNDHTDIRHFAEF